MTAIAPHRKSPPPSTSSTGSHPDPTERPSRTSSRRIDLGGLAILLLLTLVSVVPVVGALVAGIPFDRATTVAASIAAMALVATTVEIVRIVRQAHDERRAVPARKTRPSGDPR